MATSFGEQLMEHRLESVTLAQELHADGRLSDADLARVGEHPGCRFIRWYSWRSKSSRTRPPRAD